jgi:polysaccharide pyruvyl transferase WcaK-like protein
MVKPLKKLEEWRSVCRIMRVELPKELRTLAASRISPPLNGYIGWTGYGNLGDEAVLEGYQALFSNKLTDIRISKLTMHAQKLQNNTLQLRSLALGGGTLINQSDTWLIETEYALERNVPMFCIGTGVAPQSSIDRPPDATDDKLQAWIGALSQFAYVGVRGPLSQKYLNEAGFTAEVVGDSALCLAPDHIGRRAVAGRTIGINVSYGSDNIMHGDKETFISEIAKSIRILIRQGWNVRLLPIWKDDLSTCKRLRQSVNMDSQCEIVRAYRSLKAYMAALSECDVFIGQKLHATIFATMLRIPSIMLEYRPKCLDYMMSIGMERFSLRTDRVTQSSLLAIFDKLIAQRQQIVQDLEQQIRYYKALQIQRSKEITRLLNL